MIDVLIYIAGVGLLVWILTQIPMPVQFRNIIIGVACFVLIVWLIRGSGLIPGRYLR